MVSIAMRIYKKLLQESVDVQKLEITANRLKIILQKKVEEIRQLKERQKPKKVSIIFPNISI